MRAYEIQGIQSMKNGRFVALCFDKNGADVFLTQSHEEFGIQVVEKEKFNLWCIDVGL
jgi:hypothetical protein